MAACLVAPGLAAATVTYDTQYLSGQVVPGGGTFDFSTFTNIGNGSINADGEIAFLADVSRQVQIGQPFVTQSEILSEGAGSIGNPAQVVRVGDPVINAPTGATYTGFDSVTITNAGNVGFMGRRSDIPYFPVTLGELPYGGQSFFMTSPSAPASARLLASAAPEPVAFLGGETIKSIYSARFDDQGDFSLAYGKTIATVGDSPPREEVTEFGILAGDANGFTRQVPSDVFRDNYAAQNNGDTLSGDPFVPSYGFNGRGEHAFLHIVQRGGETSTPTGLVALSEAAGLIGDPQLVASDNDPIPEISQDALVSSFNGISVNNAGQHAYQVSYKSASTGNFLGNAILSESLGTPGAPGLVYREGDRVSDLLPASVLGPLTPSLDTSLSLPVISAAGHVVFLADTVPENGTMAEQMSYGGLWVRGPGPQDDVHPVYLLRSTSDHLLYLGALNGESHGGFERSILRVDVNARGQVAFTADLWDMEVEFGGNRIGETIYATDLNGDLQIIARTGRLFDVSDDPNAPDLRTIDRVTLGGFTDHGELLFNATFTDGSSGLFTAGVDAIDRIPGDFNLDGMVDAADYTTWRDGLGARFDQADYTTWVNNYGATGAPPSTAVPEPSACLLLLFAACGGARSRSR